MGTDRPGLVEALSKALVAHHEPEASCLMGSLRDSIYLINIRFVTFHLDFVAGYNRERESKRVIQ
jgi:hypothetical protein